MKRVVIVDGLNLLFKVFYGIPNSIKDKRGYEIKGELGFIGSLKRIVKDLEPYSLMVIFDSETSKNNNLKLDVNYKKNRKNYSNVSENDNPFSQLPLIKKALDFLDIAYIEVTNYEADDYIASLVNNIQFEYVIVSTDTDFIQLVNNHVFLYVLKGKNSKLYTKEDIIKTYNITPKQYVIYKSLVGDVSDNIKGIKGIGKVNATKILANGSIHKFIINNPDSKNSKILLANLPTILKNIKLIKLDKSIDTSSISIHELSGDAIALKTFEIINKSIDFKNNKHNMSI